MSLKPEAAFRKPSPLRRGYHENTQLLYSGQSTSTEALWNQASTCQATQSQPFPPPQVTISGTHPLPGACTGTRAHNTEGRFLFFPLSSLHFEVIYKTASQQPAEEKNLRPDTGISMEELREEISPQLLFKARIHTPIFFQNRSSTLTGKQLFLIWLVSLEEHAAIPHPSPPPLKTDSYSNSTFTLINTA